MIIKTFNAAMKKFGKTNVQTIAHVSKTTSYQVVYDFCKQHLTPRDAKRVSEMVCRELGVSE